MRHILDANLDHEPERAFCRRLGVEAEDFAEVGDSYQAGVCPDCWRVRQLSRGKVSVADPMAIYALVTSLVPAEWGVEITANIYEPMLDVYIDDFIERGPGLQRRELVFRVAVFQVDGLPPWVEMPYRRRGPTMRMASLPEAALAVKLRSW